MQIAAAPVFNPAKQLGPASPLELAKKRDQALMATTDKKVDPVAGAKSNQAYSAEKIARGADPKEVLGIIPQDTEAPTGGTAQGRVAELISRGADPEMIFASIAGAKQESTAHAQTEAFEARQQMFEAHRTALQGYASAASAFAWLCTP